MYPLISCEDVESYWYKGAIQDNFAPADKKEVSIYVCMYMYYIYVLYYICVCMYM